MSFPFQAVNDRIIVQAENPETHRISGLVIPGIAQEVPMRGLVVDVGPGLWDVDRGVRLSNSCEVGDRIFFMRFSGQEIVVGEKDYIIIKDAEVLAVARR
jgi:chaperonin GroES